MSFWRKIMLSFDSKVVPIAFWIAFLALGFVTSLAGRSKPHPVNEAFVAETDGGNGGAPTSAED
jgi:hypothetical protein